MAISERHSQPPLLLIDSDSLAIAAQRGDPDAFATLVKRHRVDVYRFLRRYLQDDGLAMDATQNTFVALHRHLAHYQPRGRFTAYLKTLARNQGRMTVRSRWLTMRHPLPLDLAAPRCASPDIAHDIHRVLRGVSERLRVVVVLRYWLGLTAPEIAGVLGIPTGTVKRRLFDAIRRMRRALEVEV